MLELYSGSVAQWGSERTLKKDQTSERLVKWSEKGAARGAMNQNRTERGKIPEQGKDKEGINLSDPWRRRRRRRSGCGKSNGRLYGGNVERRNGV